MSIASALNNAVSGLTAAARGSEVVSANLANALTPGYGRRELELSPRVHGGVGGVQIVGVNRMVSTAALGDYRLSNASLSGSSVKFDFFSRLEETTGIPTQDGSLSSLLGQFDAALVSAAARPDMDVRLSNVVSSATVLTQKIQTISKEIQDARSDADRKIANQVDALNSGLQEVARLNKQIIIERANGREPASLEDARQAVIDKLSSIVPLKEVQRDNGRIALFTKGGAVLLDGKEPAQFGFSPAGTVVPQKTVEGGGLSTLTIDGEPITSGLSGLLAGGSLSALFDIRDRIAPSYQAKLDGFARDLIERFASSDVDPTLNAGQSGLFTDLRGDFDPANEVGLASRISVNPKVNVEDGGELRYLRDGMNSTVAGDVGDSTILQAMLDSMSAIQTASSESAPRGALSANSYAGMFVSEIAASRLDAETKQAHANVVQTSLRSALYENGVDTDRELEQLMAMEKAYAANAKVIKAIDEMLDTILGI